MTLEGLPVERVVKEGFETMSKQKITDAIGAVLEGAEVKHLVVDEAESLVTMIVEATAMDARAEKALSRQIAKVVKIDLGFKGLKLSIEQTAASIPSDESVAGTKYITITSGKGGVGKSTVAGNLAVALARLGQKVGMIDADIYGPSLPKVFGLAHPKLMMNDAKKILPVMNADGVAVMSTEFLTEDDKPLMWRGPMLGRMLKHFFDDVQWDTDLDFVIVDLPPGTGDVPMDIKNQLPEAKAIVVTTPNQMASHIAIKSGQMAQHLGHDLIGVVENMSYFTNPVNGAPEQIFGAGGGAVVAEKLGTQLLAEIPIAQVKDGSDGSGIFAVHEENGVAYLGLANKILKFYG
ncbi:MAG: Mrp/NBP35 family ATP-binding protein [Turicibacter sp.]|nr:Mrp/NBP35 family ATP-binding protein [Turicibacter sp.]